MTVYIGVKKFVVTDVCISSGKILRGWHTKILTECAAHHTAFSAQKASETTLDTLSAQKAFQAKGNLHTMPSPLCKVITCRKQAQQKKDGFCCKCYKNKIVIEEEDIAWPPRPQVLRSQCAWTPAHP
jgi:hypothetical protein